MDDDPPIPDWKQQLEGTITTNKKANTPTPEHPENECSKSPDPALFLTDDVEISPSHSW